VADIVTLGECMAVVYPAEPIPLDETSDLQIDIGGAEANCSIRLAQLGLSVSYLTRVGDDPFGRRIVGVLNRFGVDTSAVIVDAAAPTGIFFREWLRDGARRVYYYRAGSAASRMQPSDLQPSWFAGARAVHLTGITPALSASCAATLSRAIDLARAAGALVVFDPNYRAKLWSQEAARAALLPLIARTDILLTGHEDALAAFGTDQPEEIAARAFELGVQVVVVKLAEQGAWGATTSEQIAVPAAHVPAVLDPVGAGDAFDAGFLAGWLRSGDLRTALELGAHCGAVAVAHLGDYAGDPNAPL
jgi:2-dehydro-3-deoxygluconokinase